MIKKTFKVMNPDKEINIVDFLHDATLLSKSLIKKILDYGGCQLQKNSRGSLKRVRKAKYIVKLNDQINFCFDEKIINTPEFLNPICLLDQKEYGIWFKPAGILSAGNEWSDHTSLLRAVEKIKDEVFLVHRLDRETAGIMLIAYTKKAAALFGDYFQKNKIKKNYYALIKGELKPGLDEHTIDLDLDGKSAKTLYKVIYHDAGNSCVDIELITGRLHQIRRHFDLIGHPVVGDSRYGKNNKNTDGLKLVAYSMSFECPMTNKKIHCSLDPSLISFKVN